MLREVSGPETVLNLRKWIFNEVDDSMENVNRRRWNWWGFFSRLWAINRLRATASKMIRVLCKLSLWNQILFRIILLASHLWSITILVKSNRITSRFKFGLVFNLVQWLVITYWKLFPENIGCNTNSEIKRVEFGSIFVFVQFYYTCMYNYIVL